MSKVEVVNLDNAADMVGAAVGAAVGALAGPAYGWGAILAAWWAALHGEWPMRSGVRWDEVRLVAVADRLAASSASVC